QTFCCAFESPGWGSQAWSMVMYDDFSYARHAKEDISPAKRGLVGEIDALYAVPVNEHTLREHRDQVASRKIVQTGFYRRFFDLFRDFADTWVTQVGAVGFLIGLANGYPIAFYKPPC